MSFISKCTILVIIFIKHSSMYFFIPLIHIHLCIEQHIPFSPIILETMANLIMMLSEKLYFRFQGIISIWIIISSHISCFL